MLENLSNGTPLFSCGENRISGSAAHFCSDKGDKGNIALPGNLCRILGVTFMPEGASGGQLPAAGCHLRPARFLFFAGILLPHVGPIMM